MKKLLSNIRLFSQKANEHHIYMLAAGISFNIILYVLPLFLVLMYFLTKFFDYGKIITIINTIAGEALPQTEGTSNFVQSVITEINGIFSKSSYLGIIGFFILLWVSSTLVSAFRTSLNRIFELHSPRIFILYRLKDILLTIIFTLLILLYSYALPLISIADSIVKKVFPDKIEWIFSQFVISGFSILTGLVLYYFIFSYVPNQKIPRKARFTSTILCIILMEISRNIFAWYISTIANYGKFYGTYAIIVSIAFWIYYSSLIILFSAEVGHFTLMFGKDKQAVVELG